jgi:hypothetical protein
LQAALESNDLRFHTLHALTAVSLDLLVTAAIRLQLIEDILEVLLKARGIPVLVQLFLGIHNLVAAAAH